LVDSPQPENRVIRPSQSRARLYQTVAEKLAGAIADGHYQIGDRLPPERELAASFEVSRPTIREAIIALELDGLIEARMGSGVYVIAARPAGDHGISMGIGPFELTEARLIFESEVAALAASQITAEEITALEGLLKEMEKGNRRGNGEIADREFHQRIADATRNSAISSIVDSLWTIRNSSPQCVRMFEKSKSKGYLPVAGEHRAILEALRAGNADAARVAMQNHLKRVLTYLLNATEVEAIEETKAKMAAQRERFKASIQR
jgi:GntR family transcriptional regulator, hexuronate regulon transcriptional repressor